MDHVRLINQIKIIGKHKYNRTFKLGGKPRPLKEITPTKGKNKNWTLASNQPIQLECDSKDAPDLKKLVFAIFHPPDVMQRAGFYNVRVLPSLSLSLLGSDGLHKRAAMLRKHQAVVEALSLFTTTDIKHLDQPISSKDKRTLRRIVMEMTFPLIPPASPPPNPLPRLIHSIDFASQGEAARNGSVYITFYKDRRSFAESFFPILPAYISSFINPEAAKQWFHPHVRNLFHDVTFVLNDTTGEWTGEWKTSDEDQMEDDLLEDVGIEFDLQGLNLVLEDEKVHATTDDFSVTSFRSKFGVDEANNNTDAHNTDSATTADDQNDHNNDKDPTSNPSNTKTATTTTSSLNTPDDPGAASPSSAMNDGTSSESAVNAV
jgi:hypothetical protein